MQVKVLFTYFRSNAMKIEIAISEILFFSEYEKMLESKMVHLATLMRSLNSPKDIFRP